MIYRRLFTITILCRWVYLTFTMFITKMYWHNNHLHYLLCSGCADSPQHTLGPLLCGIRWTASLAWNGGGSKINIHLSYPVIYIGEYGPKKICNCTSPLEWSSAGTFIKHITKSRTNHGNKTLNKQPV